MKKLLYPLVILAVVYGYAKLAQRVVGEHEVRGLAAMLTVDLGKIIDAGVELIRSFGRMVTS